MRPKTPRRLLILAAITVAFVVLAGTLFFVRRGIQQRKLIAARDAGLAAFAQGRYGEAFTQLAVYLRPLSNRKDPEVVYKFALSNKLAPEGGREHLELAKNWFQVHLSLKPDSIESWKHLVDIYPRLGRITEALDATERVIAVEPANTKALRTRIECQLVLGRTAKAMESAEKLAEALPDDIENNVRVLLFMRTLGRTAEILPRVEKICAAGPDSAASEVLMSVAYSLVDEFTPQQRAAAWAQAEKIDPDRAIRKRRDPNVAADSFGNFAAAVLFARKAAAQPLGDIAVTQVIVSQLDRLGLIFDSLALLEKVDPAIDNPWVRGPLIMRLWECNRFPEVNRRLADFTLTHKTPAEIELLAVRAICLAQTGKPDEASAIADQLAQLNDNRTAAAWAIVLRQQYLGAAGDLSKLTHVVKEAIDAERDRAWPYLWAALGEAYAALGERDLAVFAFARAREGAPLWFVPRLRLSRLLFETGQPEAAVAEAEAARIVLPHPLTQGNYLVISASRTPAGASVDPEIAKRVTALQKDYPGDEATLPLYLYILVQADQKDAARKALRDALAREKPLSATSLIGLAVASRSSGLGLENECIDVALKKYGMTPDLALAQASMLGAAGTPADLVARYRQAREEGAKAENEVAWRLGWVRLLESVRDPGAAAAWAELGDDPALKANLVVQKAVLGSAVAQTDRALIDRTIERLKGITGEDAAVWRVARARSLLQENTPASIVQARQLLTETIRVVPASADAHLLLGAVLELQGEPDAALKSYAEAARLRPSPAVTLQLIRLNLQRSDFAKSRELLNSLSLAQLDRTQQIQIAMFYTQLGDISRATAIVKELGDIATDPANGLFLVQLDRKNGNIARAESRLNELLRNPTLPVIVAAADFHAAAGQMEQARATLDKLQSITLKPGERELVEAEFMDRYGDAKAAPEKFAAAARAAPADARVQVAYISNLLRLNRFDEAVAAARLAAASIPSYVPLAEFLKQEQALTLLKGRPEAMALGDSILRGHADSRAASDAIGILAANRNEPAAQVVSRLRPLADRSPLLAPLQMVMVGGYRAMGQLGEAANIATRTARAIPTSVDFARLAAQMLAETGEWSQAHAAARTWRQLAPGDRLGADLLCAEASLRLTDYPAALRELAPHLAAAQKDPAAFADVIRMQARILVLSGDYDRASELLQPLLKEKPWRIYYYYLASLLIKNVDVAARWFTELSQVIPADQIDERVNLAGGWIDKGIKNKREDFRNTGRDMLRNLMGSNADTVTVVYGSALFQAEDGDRKAGEAGYRKVLTMDPRHTLAMNNLAMLLAEDNRNLDEAASLIGKALEIQPNVPAFIDTLAFVEGKRKNQSAAVAAIQKAIALDPVNPLWRLRKVELRLDFSDRDGASQAIGEIDQLNKKLFSEEIMERIQALRKRVSGTPATLPTGR